jgi:hypothetical protein
MLFDGIELVQSGKEPNMSNNGIYSPRFPWRSFYVLSLFLGVTLGEIYLAPSHGLFIGGGALVLVAMTFKEQHRHITDCILDLARWLVDQVAGACIKALRGLQRVNQVLRTAARRAIHLSRTIGVLRREGVAPRLRNAIRKRILRWAEKI